jgi:RNA polymerase sigma-70 factor (ECF subfamily)
MKYDKSNIFILLVEKHKGIIYKIANSFCHNDEDRKDLVQEIILQVWRSFDNYNKVYKESTWIYRIALNVAISFYRKEKSRKKMAHPFPEEIFQIAAMTQQTVLKEDMLLLQQFIHALKELDKAVMLLYLEEKTYSEIATIIGITETNVATKINRIKMLLKQKFVKTIN